MKTYALIIITSLLIHSLPTTCRSFLRPRDPQAPQLIAKWADGTEEYQITDSHIEEYPLFVVYNDAYFNAHLLPRTDIAYRYNNECSVSGAVLNDLIEHVLKEIKACKKKFTHFYLIQDKDFNHRKAAGLIVLQFKNYPFILKLFIETPESFVKPWCKGAEPVWFFYMGGGVNRHMTGLTRIKNLEFIRDKLKEHPKWTDFVDTPRKWYWAPHNQQWVKLIGKNLGGKKEITTCIPSMYAVVADAIMPAQEATIFDKHRRKIALELCNTLDLFIDPHIDNFMVEYGTNKLVIIDTEHFPTLVGLKEKQTFKTYLRWYLGLAKKATHDIFFRLKSERKQAQFKHSELRLFEMPICNKQVKC